MCPLGSGRQALEQQTDLNILMPPQPDGSDVFTYVSSGSRDLLELEPEAILQDSNLMWACVHPEDFSSLQLSVAVAVKNLEPWEWKAD